MSADATFSFDELFDAEEYLYFLADSLREENTAAQVDFIERVLEMSTPMRVVDLGCGHGRHANELARRKHDVTGLDLVAGFVQHATDEAKRDNLSTRFIRGDMRAFAAEQPFDRAVCLFDAFGFFTDADNTSVLRCAFDALTPGGMLLLDLRTREWMTRIAPVSVVDKGNGDLMIDRYHFDIETGRLVDRRTTIRAGRVREVSFSFRLYAYTEIRTVLESVGFTVRSVFGGFDGSRLSAAQSRTIIVATRS